MAAIPVTIVGTMTYTDVGIGGGPIFPPAGGGGGQPVYPSHPIYWPPVVSPPIYYPPGTEPGAPRPEHPIYLPPTSPGAPPSGAHPEHPIYYPPPPEPEGPPTGEGRWGWVQPPGVWVWVPAQPGKPHPPIDAPK